MLERSKTLKELNISAHQKYLEPENQVLKQISDTFLAFSLQR